jgi:hypothetical protein
MVVISYIKDRLGERSTWAAIGVAVTGAAAVAAPYSYILIAVGVIGAIVPTSTKETDNV